jgi:endo-1,4-beta-xylanase
MVTTLATATNLTTAGLTTNAAGTVRVRATITNGETTNTDFWRDTDITINPASVAFIPVTDITGVPTNVTVGATTLTGTVVPAATNQAIMWSVEDAGTTGATISGNTLTTTTVGTVEVRATIANGLAFGTPYTQDFTITVDP